MRVMVTGVSGLNRERAWSSMTRQLVVHDLGKLIIDLAEERHMELTEHNILHAGRDTRAALRAAAINRIRPSFPQDGDKDKIVVVSAHSVFSRLDALEEGLLMEDLSDLRPEVWITLIDGPQAIEERLKGHGAEYFHMTVWDIVKWQELEVFFAHHLASDLQIKHYVVPVNQPEVFQAIVESDQRPTAYVSYPMSHAPEELKPKIAEFVEKLKVHYIVFDPSSIESSHGLKPHHSQRDRQAIGSHTIVRDLDWFIKINADEVIAYWPAVIFTSGMSDELRYAFEQGKRTVLVTERKEEGGLPILSPFMTYKCTVFWSSDEFFSFLELSEDDQEIARICQDVMIEVSRYHDAGAINLSKKLFVGECQRAVQYRLPIDKATKAKRRVKRVADKVFQSWTPILDKASRKGTPRQPLLSKKRPRVRRSGARQPNAVTGGATKRHPKSK
jgi:adenylate kinase